MGNVYVGRYNKQNFLVRYYSTFHNGAEELTVKLEPAKNKVFGEQRKMNACR